MLPASRKKTTASWLRSCRLSMGESNFHLCTGCFRTVPLAGFHQTSSFYTLLQELMPSSASSPQVPIKLTGIPPTPHLFVSSFFALEQLWLLHTRVWMKPAPPPWYCTGYQARGLCQVPLPILSQTHPWHCCPHCCYAQASEESCSVTLPLTSYRWYQLELGQATVKSCSGRCPGPGGSHNAGVICGPTGLQLEV